MRLFDCHRPIAMPTANKRMQTQEKWLAIFGMIRAIVPAATPMIPKYVFTWYLERRKCISRMSTMPKTTNPIPAKKAPEY